MVLGIVISVLLLGVFGLIAFAMWTGRSLNINIKHTIAHITPTQPAPENKDPDADKDPINTIADVVQSINAFMLGEDEHE